MYHYKKNILKTWSAKIFLTGFFLLFFFSSQAQFVVTENFRGSGNPDIIIGDDAILTSGNGDPIGAGWLRLTPAVNQRKGYAFVNKSFPSSMGLLIEFEYKMWRTATNLSGADGIGVFLFDGTIDANTFKLGGYGGSLGFARNTSSTPSVPDGLSGGYVGIGLDAFGNFANNNEGRLTGPGEKFNAVTLRGPTTTNNTNVVAGGIQSSNRYLTHQDLGTNSTRTKLDNEIDYNTGTATRPPDDGTGAFYRRIKIEIIPVIVNGSNFYDIKVYWIKTFTGINYVNVSGAANNQPILTYRTTDVPPSLLKIGFAASTGADHNNHEIRNLLITTPNNLRVSKRANRDIIQASSATSGTTNQIVYYVDVINDSDQPYTNASFVDEVVDVNGNVLPISAFEISSVTTTGFTGTPTIAVVAGQNRITGNFTIPALTTARVTVTGRLKTIPTGNTFTNKVTVMPTGSDVDFDLGNNTANVSTPVIADGVDLVLSKSTVGDACLDPTDGNTYELRVVNMGTGTVSYRRPGYDTQRIVVTKTIPAGYTYSDSSTPGGFTTNASTTAGSERWFRSPATIPSGALTSPLTVTYVARGSSNSAQTLGASGATYETDYPIRYTIKPPAGTTSFVDAAKVEYRTSSGAQAFNGANIEPTDNQPNSTNSQTIFSVPAAPTVPSTTIYYCLGDTPSQLSATAASGNTLLWSQNQGGVTSTTAPTPSTSVAGTTSYFVSQTNGSCEGPAVQINVIVLPTPSAGVIAGAQTTCSGAGTATITSTTAGQATGWPTGTAVTYRWESSANGSTGWNTISGATSVTYAPGALTATTHYRRITVATISGKSCESAVTNTVVKTVNTVNAGSISGDQTICTAGPFTQIGSTTPGSGAGTFVYRWESSATGAAGSWTTISGATAATYTPVNTVTTYFRRVTISTLNSIACEAASNTIVKAVNTVNAGAISGDQTICTGGSFTQIGSTTAGSGAGSVTYRWESSATGAAGSWTTISGATAVTYTPVNTVTTYFRRVTISTLNAVACEAASNTIVKTVNTVNAGVVAGNQNICTGISPAQITSTTPGSGAGTITYRWEISTTGTGGWSTISGATGTTYTPVNTTTMCFRRVTISTLNTIPCEAASSVITVAFKNCKMITNPMIRQRTK